MYFIGSRRLWSLLLIADNGMTLSLCDISVHV